MLCTVDDQPAYLAEIRRVLGPEARFGLIVYGAAHRGDLDLEAPEGNDFPTVEALDELLAARHSGAGQSLDRRLRRLPRGLGGRDGDGPDELERRHGDDPRWQTAEGQSGRMGSLLAAGEVRGRLLVVRPD